MSERQGKCFVCHHPLLFCFPGGLCSLLHSACFSLGLCRCAILKVGYLKIIVKSLHPANCRALCWSSMWLPEELCYQEFDGLCWLKRSGWEKKGCQRRWKLNFNPGKYLRNNPLGSCSYSEETYKVKEIKSRKPDHSSQGTSFKGRVEAGYHQTIGGVNSADPWPQNSSLWKCEKVNFDGLNDTPCVLNSLKAALTSRST